MERGLWSSRAVRAARTSVAAAVALCAWSGDVDAAANPGLRNVNAFGVRSNRQALGLFSDIAWRTPLSDSDSVLLKDTYLDAGAVVALSPASFHPGVFIEALPVALLKLRASVQRLQYFGAFGGPNVYPDGDWSPEALDEDFEKGGGLRTGGWRADARAQLRLKVWRILALGELAYTSVNVDLEDPFVESTLDLYVEPEDDVRTMTATVGALLWGDLPTEHLALAARWERYDTDETNVTRQILGGGILWRPPAEWWSTGNPQVLFLAGSFVEDPFREGELYLAGQLTMTFED